AAGGLVPDIGDAGDPPVADHLGDALRQVVRVDLVGQFADYQAGAALDLLDLHHGAHGDRAAAGAVGLLDAADTQDLRTGGEVRALDPLQQRCQQFLGGGVRVFQEPVHAVGHFAQVVRGDVGGHAHRDPRRPVDQEVGDARGQDVRFLGAAVVVVPEIDGVLVDVADHLHGQRHHLALGVPRC